MSIDLVSASWYLARGSGVSALVLFTLVVVLGMATRAARPVAGAPRFAVRALHSSAALTAVVFLGLHVVALLFDPYAQLRLVDLVLPFGGAYRPFWLGLGTLALDLVLAIGVSSWLRGRIGPRAWKAVHWTAYAAWPFAVLHGLGTGTDAGTWWLRAVTAACVAAVLGALAWRRSSAFEAARRPTLTRPGRPLQGSSR